MRTVRRTDAFRHCPNAHQKRLNLPSLFDTIHNKISLCTLATDLKLIYIFCSISLQLRLFIATPYSTVSVIHCFFILYSKTGVSISYLLPSVCYILYYMIGAQLFLQLHFVPHRQYTPSVVLCAQCLMFNCIFGLSSYFTQNTSVITMATNVCHSAGERPSSSAPFPWTYLDYIWQGTSYNSPTTNFKLLCLFPREEWLPQTAKHTDTLFVT
jgi:hypothetical protein